MNELDGYDRAILAILQQDATLSYAEVGERVNLSASAALRRVQRMRENGVITATRVIVDAGRIGYPLTIVVEIWLENEHSAALEGTKQALAADPHVQQCFYVTGEADLFAVLVVPSMAAYKDFADRHFLGNINVKKFKTSVVMESVKSTTLYPI